MAEVRGNEREESVSHGDDVDPETALDRAARQAAAITIELGWQRYLDRRTFARMKEAMYQAVSGSARALTQTRTPHASTCGAHKKTQQQQQQQQQLRPFVDSTLS